MATSGSGNLPHWESSTGMCGSSHTELQHGLSQACSACFCAAHSQARMSFSSGLSWSSCGRQGTGGAGV